MKKKEGGAIIVEATLVLPFFMFAIITVLSIVNICFTQAKVGVALNQTAKEISEYSYLYGLTGLNKKQAGLYADGANARASIDEIAGGVTEMFSSVTNMGNAVQSASGDPVGSFNTIESEFNNAKGGFSSITSGAKALASDPTAILKMLANDAIEMAKSFLIEIITPVFMEKHFLRADGDSSELFLKYLGIVPKNGSYMDGLDFGQSVIFLNGSEEIKLIVKYEIQVWQLLGIDIKIPFTQCAATKAWFAAEAPNLVAGTSSTNNSGGGGEGDSDNTQTNNSTGTENTKSESDKNGNVTNDGGGNTAETTTQEEKPKLKSAAEYAKNATQNDSSTQVVLGKYNSDFNGKSYIDMAIEYDATYFDLDDYDEIASQSSPSFMWQINEQFLEQQEAKGKQFLLVDDPYHATGAYANEVNWLQNHGYTFKFDPGRSVWKAVKDDG